MRDYDPIGFTEEEQKDMERMMKESFDTALKEDPFYNPKLRKSKKESKEKKEFSGYNWTTHKKMSKGRKRRIKELKEKDSLSREEEIELKRIQNLEKWYRWARKLVRDGKSDKWIHEETQKRRKEAKASK